MMYNSVRDLVHTLYHYEVIHALSDKNDETEYLIDKAKDKHSERLSYIREALPKDLESLMYELQQELMMTVDNIPDATRVEKAAVREYIDSITDYIE